MNNQVWFTGWDAHVAIPYDNHRNYPWHAFRENYATRISRTIRSVADTPDLTQYELPSDITRDSTTMAFVPPIPQTIREFHVDGEANRKRWLRERNLQDLYTHLEPDTKEEPQPEPDEAMNNDAMNDFMNP